MSNKNLKSSIANRKSAYSDRDKLSSKDIVSEVSAILSRCVSDASFVFAALFTLFIVVTHGDDVHSGPIGDFLNHHKDNKMAEWVIDNWDKALGVLVFLPVSLRVPKSLRSIVFSASVLGIMVFPPFHTLVYFVASTGVLLFINFKNPIHKLVSLVVPGYYLYREYVATKTSSMSPPRFG